MQHRQAEQIYALMARPEWQAFLAYKQDRLTELHERLEWDDKHIHKAQGQIAEIRADLNLIRTVNEFLDTQQGTIP